MPSAYFRRASPLLRKMFLRVYLWAGSSLQRGELYKLPFFGKFAERMPDK